MKKILPILLFFLFLTVIFSRPANAAIPTFAWRVTDQNGNPLAEALVWVYWKGQYFTWCSTDSSGHCSVGLSCATPCELSGDVEYQGYTGSYSGSYSDGALIEVVINIPTPTPTPGPSPYPSPTPPPEPPPPGFACGSSAGERVSRPDPCELCNATGLFCPSCATSMSVHDAIEFRRDECFVSERWGGTISTSDTTIPFVGHTGDEDEIRYLADYFEGTNEYYKNYGKYWLDWVNHAGVWRKLTPMEYQNQLKKEMVQREINSQPGQEGSIHDYKLNYIGRLCWDLPFLGDVFLALAQRYGIGGSAVKYIADHAHYCLFSSLSLNPFDDALIAAVHAVIESFNKVVPAPLEIGHQHTNGVRNLLSELAGHFPPEPDEEDYVEKWDAWKESEWGRLWEVVPMASREDTPGYINPYLGAHPGDSFTVYNREEKVPHVARLYEASQEVQNMLTPYGGAGGVGQEKTGPILASAKDQVLGEKTLLAQLPPIPRGCKFLYANPDCGCCERGDCLGRHTEYPIPNKMGPLCGWEDCDDGTPNFCGTYTGPPGPGGVSVCDRPAITDPNDNDNLCISTRMNLDALEEFEYADCVGCYYDCECCDPPLPPGCGRRCLCNPECRDVITRDVSREIGINLLHPYLTEIWQQTGEDTTNGLFNFFRPATYPEFQEIDAASEIHYSYADTSDPSGGRVSPETGKFYFNYLGGVQLAKDWLIRALTPWVE